MKHPLRSLLSLSLIVSFALTTTPLYSASTTITRQFDLRILEAKEIFEQFTRIPEKGIPADFVSKARVLVFFPNYVRGGFLGAAKFGLGMVIVRDRESDAWSPPAFVRLSGASFGLQAGLQWTDLILVGKGDVTLENILYSRFTVSGNTSATAGFWGRDIQFNIDWPLRSSLFAYSRSSGLFLGVAMDGAVLSYDDNHNELYYGKGMTGRDVLYGKRAQKSPAAQELIKAIESYARTISLPEPQVQLAALAPAPAPQPAFAPQIIDDQQRILLLKRMVKDVRIYFDYDRAQIRSDALPILNSAISTMQRDNELSIVISGHADVRGSKDYNSRLGSRRAQAVRSYIAARGISASRIRVVSRGELDALAPTSDLVGMQRDRHAHFVIAEVQETELRRPPPPALQARRIGKSTYMTRERMALESDIRVSTREYVVKKGDTLSKIARSELGSSYRWEHLYVINADRIRDPHSLRMGQRILIPVE